MPQPPEAPEAWAALYPTMRSALDTAIRANRTAHRPAAHVPHLVQVRRDLGHLHHSTTRSRTGNPPAYSPHAALRLVREVLAVISLGSPHAAAIYRLAADLADQTADLAAARRTTT